MQWKYHIHITKCMGMMLDALANIPNKIEHAKALDVILEWDVCMLCTWEVS